MNLKIGIIGAGTASSIGLLAFYKRMQDLNFPNVETVLINDPAIPITHVGESASALVFRLLYDLFEFEPTEDLEPIDGTLRWCSKYFWEDASGKNFSIKYGAPPGLHVNSQKFSSWVIEKITNKFKSHSNVEDHILEIKQETRGVKVIGSNRTYEFDYIIDCTGTPPAHELDSSLYNAPNFTGVNSVILYQDMKEYNEMHTSAYVHENGWMFGVPLTFRKAFGYCYNNQITTEAEAIEKFSDLKKINANECRRFSWRQYYRTNAIDGKILYLGNRLYFFEPHQALPLHYYAIIVFTFVDMLLENSTKDQLNQFHNDSIETLQNLIALNYAGKNAIDSKFWNYTKPLAIQRLKNSQEFVNYCQKSIAAGEPQPYWTFSNRLMESYVNGYGLNLNDFT